MRGRGIGQALWKAAIEHCNSHGVTNIGLTATASECNLALEIDTIELQRILCGQSTVIALASRTFVSKSLLPTFCPIWT